MVSVPATLVAVFAAGPEHVGNIGTINLPMWVCIAPAQTVATWFGAQLAQRIGTNSLSGVFAGALAVTGVVMLRSSFG